MPGGLDVIAHPQPPTGPTTRRPVAHRHPATIAVAGAAAAAVVVLAAGRAPVPVGMVLPDSFAGVLSPARGGGGLAAAAVIVGVAVLLLGWWRLLAAVSTGRLAMRTIGWITAAWAAPVLAGPLLLSYDGYAYLAQGEMAAQGLDPYAAGPVALGSDPALDRVDPMWRSSPTPYGPVFLVALRAVAVLDVGLTGSVLALRLLAVVGVAAAVAGALLLSPPARRPLVLVLVLANPVTLLHLLGGAHLDAVVAGLVTLALVALRSGRSWSALLLAALAVACKVTVLPVLVLLVLVLVRRRGAGSLWTAALAVALPFLVTGLILDRPWGFLDALMVSGSAAPWYAPASLVGLVLRGATALVGLPLGAEAAAATGRVLVLAVGTAAVAWVLLAVWRDSGDGAIGRTIARAGVVLVLVALSLPSLYSWYLGPAVFVVAATGAARLRHLLVVLCSLLSFSSMPSLYDASPWVIGLAWAVALSALGAGAVRLGLLTRPGPAPAWAAATPTGAAPGRPPRLLLASTRVLELTVLPALALAVTTTGAQARVPDVAATRAQSDSLQEVARLSAAVSAAYPEHKVAQVLPADRARVAAGDFDVRLVLPGERERACWLRVGPDAVGLPRRVPDGRGEGVPGSCPAPMGPRVLGGLSVGTGSGAGR